VQRSVTARQDAANQTNDAEKPLQDLGTQKVKLCCSSEDLAMPLSPAAYAQQATSDVAQSSHSSHTKPRVLIL
jgi:hypothetical protein